MNRITLLLFTLTLSPFAMGQDVNLDEALYKLDYAVAKRDYYIQKKQQSIDNLKKTLETSTTNNDKYIICKRIYDEYQKFDADSALAYAHRCEYLAKMTKQYFYFKQAKIDEMMILIYRGEYIAAKERLTECGPIEDIPSQIQPDYAMAVLEYYMRMQNKYIDVADPLCNNAELCWDKYKKYIPANSWCYDYYESVLPSHHIENKLINDMKGIPRPSIAAAMIEVALAKLYKQRGNLKLYYYYLMLSATDDISCGNREAQSLVYLIESPYVMKDNKRAFAYTMVCTENAKEYKDAGRSLDIVGAHATITKAFETALERKSMYLFIIIVLLAVLSIIIFVQMCFIISKRKRQNVTLAKLEDVNSTLHKLIDKENDMRQKLKENNERLQEELKYRNNNFINAYLLVSRYIADVRKFNTSVFNMIITGKAENAKKMLSSTVNTDEYLQNFYKQFDKAYLSTHPDFLEQFNKLMKPDKQMTMPSSDTLTPELRIYALVSLGITDSVSIADFLHYSTQTIYNYRLKIRHNSCIPEKDFADAVAKMYY